MSDLFGNHIVGFPTRRLMCFTVGAEDRHNMENYESGPESGEITNSDSEAEKRNALIKSLVNVSMENIDYYMASDEI